MFIRWFNIFSRISVRFSGFRFPSQELWSGRWDRGPSSGPGFSERSYRGS